MVRAITFAEQNKNFIIKKLIGSEKHTSKLKERGFCIGEKVCVVNSKDSNFIVRLNESKYVLNTSFASKVLVEEAL